jgi:hypothetical protein
VLAPALIVCDAGLTLMVKSVTLRMAVVLRDWPPLAPEMVSVELAAGVVADVLTVMVDDVTRPPIVVGLKVADAPAGNPLTLGVTVPVNPLSLVTVIV